MIVKAFIIVLIIGFLTVDKKTNIIFPQVERIEVGILLLERGLQKVAFFKKKKKISRKEIKKQCSKAKLKIKSLEERARRKSTSAIQRCKRAYSDLRYQACHLKKYKERAVEAVKNCNK